MSADNFESRADGTPIFLPDPMLRHTTDQLRRSEDIGHRALADVLEQQNVNTKSLEYQNRKLVTIEKQSQSNGRSIDVLEKLQLVTVVDQHKTIFAAYTLWSRWRGPLKWVGGSIASLAVVALGAFIKHLVESL